MKCMFDTNVYISFIRDRSYSSELQRRGTVKYLSAIVLMELWAGTKTKKTKIHRPKTKDFYCDNRARNCCAADGARRSLPAGTAIEWLCRYCLAAVAFALFGLLTYSILEAGHR